MLLNFTKMHGLGNDFIVLDGVRQSVRLSPKQIRRIANRHTGIGFDQLLIVEPPTKSNVDFNYRIFNSDGGEVEQCGNGARCIALFVREAKLSGKSRLLVQTMNRLMELTTKDKGEVTVDMGLPLFQAADVPFIAEKDENFHDLELNGKSVKISVISMGNPHAILWVDSVDQAPVASLGPQIAAHRCFPNGVNVNFAQIVDRSTIKLRVFERGVGETKACGSGACATAAVAITQGRVDSPVKIELSGGQLTIQWLGGNNSLMMRGPAEISFHGHVQL